MNTVKEMAEKWGNMTDENVILFFKDNENDRCKLNFLFNILLKKQRYALAKLFKNKIEILETLKGYEKNNTKEKKYTDDEVIQLLDDFRNSFQTDIVKWFEQYKK